MKSKLTKLEGIDIPKSIEFKEFDNKLKLKMNSSCINANMQENRAAFEAWALLGKAKGYNKVILDLDMDNNIKSNGHYNRFLYRIYCFKELFDWFEISDDLSKKVQEFYNKYLKDKKLIYNVPNGKAEKEPKHPEAKMEQYLATHKDITNKLLKIKADEFYQQLPVGTFYEKKSNNTRLFTGGKSAIDFWGIEKNTLNIIELKVKNNKSLGVLSEIFFYVCLMRDFHISKIAKPSNKTDLRGFNILINTEIKKIRGFILTEQIHPQLEAAFEELKKVTQKDSSISFDKIVQIPDKMTLIYN